MKVILKEDVKGLGKKESMVEVSDGYARNFLMPRGLAVEANASNLNVMNTKKEAEKNKKAKELEEAKKLAEVLKSIEVVVNSKAGEQGKLFGSITSKDIVEHLKSQHKISLDKKKLFLSEPIKSVGKYTIDVKIYPEVTSKIKVKIVAD
jgi:large subunit ribosomal protein L9